jgi:hypothetical protein
MTFAAVAVGVGTAAAGVAGSMMSASASGKAAGQAADAQTQGQAMQIASNEGAQARAYDTMRPWENSGYAAQNKLNYLLGTDQQAQLPNRSQFTTTDSLGNQHFDQQGYQNALNHFQTQSGIQAPSAPIKSAFQKPVYSKAGKIKGYTLDKAAWKQANLDYKGNQAEYFKQATNPQLVNQSQQSSNHGAGERGSLLHDYTGEDYKNDPGYTPFVNTLEDLQNTPGYQFRLQQGEQSLNNTAAAKGNLLSGAAAKEMQRYGQGFASTEYQSAWDRAQSAYQNAVNRYNTNRQTKYNMLAGQGQQGQNAAGTMATGQMAAGQNSAQIYGNTANNLANISTQNGQNQANMWGNVANSVTSGIGNAYTASQLWGNGTTQAGQGPQNLSLQN